MILKFKSLDVFLPQDLLEVYGKKEPERLVSMGLAVEAALERLIGAGPEALLVPASAGGWAWGRDLPAAASLLKARVTGSISVKERVVNKTTHHLLENLSFRVSVTSLCACRYHCGGPGVSNGDHSALETLTTGQDLVANIHSRANGGR